MNDNIDICVCTFQRPQIQDLFKSLQQMRIPDGVSIRIVVADNDETDQAREFIEDAAQSCGLSLIYVHAPARNISIARNACLENATSPVIIFVDDDETVSEEWLCAMLETYQKTKAPLILGPVQAVYGEGAPIWMSKTDFHSFQPVWVNNEIQDGYTSNLLIDRANKDVLEQRFDVSLGQSGGEDSFYLNSLYKLSHRIEFSHDAIVQEIVPDTRARLSWLTKRRYRMGQTHGMMLLSNKPASFSVRLKHILRASVKAGFCSVMGALFCWDRARRAFWILRGVLHVGVIAHMLGQRKITQYGQQEKVA